MAQCPKCGGEVSYGAEYCGQCGTRVNAAQLVQAVNRPAAVSKVFTASAYIVQTKVSESYKSRTSRTDLGIFYQLGAFEIMEPSGMLVAKARNIHGPLPSSDFNLSRLSTLRSYSMETPEGARIGELRGPVMLIPNRPYLEINDANGQEIAVIMMKAAKKPGSGFFSAAITTWVLATPSGEELARINWGKHGNDWTVETLDGMAIAEVQQLKDQEDAYQVKILDRIIDPYLIFATFFAIPPGTK